MKKKPASKTKPARRKPSAAPPRRVVLEPPRPTQEAPAETWSETPPPPRSFVGWLAVLLLAVLPFSACAEAPVEYATVCDEAHAMVQRCGATVPFLTDTPCTGLPRLISRCAVDHARGCDELAELARNPDRCLPDAGELEPEPLPVPEPDLPDGGTTS